MKKAFNKLKNLITSNKTGAVVMLSLFVVCTVAVLGTIINTYAVDPAVDTIYLKDIIDAPAETPYHKDINIFKSAYSGASQAEASSSDGSHIVAPGTSNTSKLVINNNSDTDAQFRITISSTIVGAPTKEGNNLRMPVSMNITDSEQTHTYRSIDDLVETDNQYKRDLEIKQGNQEELTFDWIWNTISDEEDTAWGNSNASATITVAFQIETIDPTPTPSKNDSGSSNWQSYSELTDNPVVSEGSWKLVDADKKQWIFTKKNDSKKATSGFYYVRNPYSVDGHDETWFHFDENGIMDYGWIKTDDETWYYANSVSDSDLGELRTGWYQDNQNGNFYYLDNSSRKMLTGWQWIDGYRYYFAKRNDVAFASWVYDTVGTPLGKWVCAVLGNRDFGSMYINEITPDGYRVDKFGRLLGADGKPVRQPVEPGDNVTPDTTGNWVFDTKTNSWYYPGENGKPKYTSSWGHIYNPYAALINGQAPYGWFYFDENGRMLTGWQWIPSNDGVSYCYYLQESSDGQMGICYLNQVVQKRQVDKEGRWVINGVLQKR